MKQSKGLWSTVVLLLCSVHCAWCYFVTVDAHSEECFFDKVSSGTKLGLTFEVVEGGFLDIDVKVRKVVNTKYYNRIENALC